MTTSPRAPAVLALSLLAALLCACVSPIAPRVWVDPDNSRAVPQAYLVADFRDFNDKQARAEHPRAAAIVKGAFIDALRAAAPGLELREFRPRDLSDAPNPEARFENEAIAHAVAQKVPGVIVGQLSSYLRGRFMGPETTVAFTVTAIDPGSQREIWRASHLKRSERDYNREPADFAREVARELVEALVERIPSLGAGRSAAEPGS